MRAPLKVSVLALQPDPRGLGYVMFQQEDRLVDWGLREARGARKNARCAQAARALLGQFSPDYLVLEDTYAKGARRRARVVTLLHTIAHDARRRGFEVRHIPRTAVLRRFAGFGAGNKHDVAAAIAALHPELAPRLPKRRRLWESERHVMAIFAAAGFALTFYANPQRSLFEAER